MITRRSAIKSASLNSWWRNDKGSGIAYDNLRTLQNGQRMTKEEELGTELANAYAKVYELTRQVDAMKSLLDDICEKAGMSETERNGYSYTGKLTWLAAKSLRIPKGDIRTREQIGDYRATFIKTLAFLESWTKTHLKPDITITEISDLAEAIEQFADTLEPIPAIPRYNPKNPPPANASTPEAIKG